MEKTVIVMPVANEEDNMERIITEILSLPYDNLYIYPVVDSYSRDNTEKIIREYEQKTDKVKCIFYKESRGVVSCYLEGFRRALDDNAARIIEMDGGGSHKPSELPRFIEKLDEGYECVWGSRFIKGGGLFNDPWYRRVLSWGGTFLANAVLGTRLNDMTSGYEAFQRKVLCEMNLDKFLSQGHMYQTEMRYYCRKRNAIEVPIHYYGGESSLKWGSIREAFQILFQLKRNDAFVNNEEVQ